MEGTDLEAADMGGQTPVLAAAAAGHLRCLDLLLKAGCDLSHCDRHGHDAAAVAAAAGHMEVVKLLMRSYGVVLSLQRAARDGHLALVRLLLHCGASLGPSSPVSAGAQGAQLAQTPREAAVQAGHTDVVVLLDHVAACQPVGRGVAILWRAWRLAALSRPTRGR